MTGHRSASTWSRRCVLALGVGALGLLAVPGSARAASVTIGDLILDLPAGISATPPSRVFGQDWQWAGRTATGGTVPDISVLARADLASSDAREILGLLLAGSATGLLPELALNVLRTRAMPGGGEQLRVNLAYAVRPGLNYHGTLLIATRSTAPAAVVAVLGNDSLTAGTIETILGGARWQ